ncbi:Antirestriction protein [Nitrosomonas sp. Nm58]|nr:antirestriction protein [Nitrosomonas sp. Nm58]SDZ16510.1 Antirestriction protein [Nitrosomonas sp. Nm58]
MSTNTTVTRQRVDEHQRIEHTAALFGVHFPLCLEPFVYALAEKLSPDYNDGYWEFYALSNGGFYMAPDSGTSFHVSCENGLCGHAVRGCAGYRRLSLCLQPSFVQRHRGAG